MTDSIPSFERFKLEKREVDDQLFFIMTIKGVMPLDPGVYEEFHKVLDYLEKIEDPFVLITTGDHEKIYCPGFNLKYSL